MVKTGITIFNSGAVHISYNGVNIATSEVDSVSGRRGIRKIKFYDKAGNLTKEVVANDFVPSRFEPGKRFTKVKAMKLMNKYFSDYKGEVVTLNFPMGLELGVIGE